MKRKANDELEIEILSKYLKIFLFHKFLLSHKATEASNNICSTMGKEVVSIRTA